jgi:hypothetical protein
VEEEETRLSRVGRAGSAIGSGNEGDRVALSLFFLITCYRSATQKEKGRVASACTLGRDLERASLMRISFRIIHLQSNHEGTHVPFAVNDAGTRVEIALDGTN